MESFVVGEGGCVVVGGCGAEDVEQVGLAAPSSLSRGRIGRRIGLKEVGSTEILHVCRYGPVSTVEKTPPLPTWAHHTCYHLHLCSPNDTRSPIS